LFILLNAILFIRPAEVVPALEGLPIYQFVIVACILFSYRAILEQLTIQALRDNPITLCVIGLLGAIALSHISHLSFFGLRVGAIEFAKVVIYYLLLVGNVNSPQRLQRFLIWLCVFMLGLTTLAVLEYEHVVDIPALAPILQTIEGEFDPVTGAPVVLARLCSSGIFNDPNDLCLSLARGAYICLYLAFDRSFRLSRWLWLAPVPLFAYALKLTYSRGGLIAFAAGLVALAYARFGWRKTVLSLAVLVPLGLSLFAGRQVNLDLSNAADTSQSRIQLWSDSFMLFREQPVFGIGEGQLAENLNYVAHNSFVHSFVELGVVGGSLFTAMFFLCVTSTYRLITNKTDCLPVVMRRMGPCVLAILVSYVAGILSLSRCYIVPTYTVVGIAAAYGRIASGACPEGLPRLDARLGYRLLIVSAACLVLLMVFVHFAVKWQQ
jgi:O-antigen ligase